MSEKKSGVAPATTRPGGPAQTDVDALRPKRSPGVNGDPRDPKLKAKENGGHLFGTFSD